MKASRKFIAVSALVCLAASGGWAAAWDETDLTAGSDNTLTLTEDSTLTVGNAVSIGKLTVAGNYTLTLAGTAAVTATSLDIASGATVQLASGTTLADGALQTSTVTGTGVIGYTGIEPDTGVDWTVPGWTGTVWVQGLTQTGWNPSAFGNANSTLRLSGFSGYFAKAQIAVPFAIELENSSYSSAMNITDGFSFNSTGGWSYFLTPTLKGSGTYTANATGGSLFVVTTDWSGFTGTFALTGKTVWLGGSTPVNETDYTPGTVAGGIRIAAGKEVTVTPNGGWTYATGFFGEGTVKLLYPWQATANTATSELFTGTVELASCENDTNAAVVVYPERMGNANSTIVLKGLGPKDGDTANYASYWFQSQTVPGTLQLDGDVTIYGNGYSGSASATVINQLTGSGSLSLLTSLNAVTYFDVTTLTNFTGALSANTEKDCIRVKTLELPSVPAADTLLFKVDETDNNVTLENIKIGTTVLAAAAVAERKTVGNVHGWYYTAAAAPFTDGDGGSYASFADAFANVTADADGYKNIYVNYSVTVDDIPVAWGTKLNLFLADGVTLTASAVHGEANTYFNVKLQSGASDATFKFPVGSRMPDLRGWWYDRDAGVKFHVYGDFSLGDTLFTYGENNDKFGSVDTSSSGSIGVVTTDKGNVRFAKVPHVDSITTQNGSTHYFNAIVAGRKYYWIGGDAGVWNSAANWQYADGVAAGEVPGGTSGQYGKYDGDKLIFTNDTALTINAYKPVAAFQFDAHVTVSGDAYSSNQGNYLYCDTIEGTGFLTMSGATIAFHGSGRPLSIATDVEIAANTTNHFVGGQIDNHRLSGNLTGSGKLYIRSAGNFYLSGDNSEFYGEIENTLNGGSYQRMWLDGSQASSENAIWKFSIVNSSGSTSTGTRYLTTDDDTYYLGGVDGTVYIADGTPSFIIGNRSDFASVFNMRTHVERLKGNLVKEGTNTLLYTGYANTITLKGGETTIAASSYFGTSSIAFKGNGATIATPSYLTTVGEETITVYRDISSYIKNSTSAIGFDTGAENFTWATALAASNVGGLTKKGTGTLTLTAVPLCSGPLTVEAGELVMPAPGTAFSTLSLGDDAVLKLDLSGYTADGVLFSAAIVAGTTVTDSNVVLLNNNGGYSVAQNASGTALLVMKGSGREMTWSPGQDSDYAWDTAANWTVGGNVAEAAPTALDTVVFTTADPGVTNAADVTVCALRATAAEGLTLSAGVAINVLADASIEGGALTLDNATFFNVNGDYVVDSLTLASAGCYAKSVAYTAAGYQAKVTLNKATTLSSVSGAGVLAGDGDLTFNVAAGTTNRYTGAVSGNRNFAKSGDGTLILFANSDYTGDLAVNAGTVKLATPLDLEDIRADFDASDETSVYTVNGVVRWHDQMRRDNDLAFLWNGSTNPAYVEDANIFNGKKVLYSDSFKMVEPNNLYGSSLLPLSSFFVVQNTTGAKNTIAGDYSNGNWGLFVRNASRSSAGVMSRTYNTWHPQGVWGNGALGVQDETGGGAKIDDDPAVVTVVRDWDNDSNGTSGSMWIRYKTGRAYIGGDTYQAFAEYLTYNREFSYDEKAAVEQYLMAKWGIGDVEWTPLPKTADVTVADGATLDLGGQAVTVASADIAGTLVNGALKTAAGVVWVSGNATVEASAGAVFKVKAGGTGARLTLTGSLAAGESVVVDASAATAPITIATSLSRDDGQIVFSGQPRWSVTERTGGYRYGAYPFIIRLR